MAIRAHRPTALILAVTMAIGASSAVALLISQARADIPVLGFDLGLHGGIDKQTIEFLEHYPQTMRKELIIALSDAADIIQKQEDHLFEKIDDTVDRVFDDVQCTIAQLPDIPQTAITRVIESLIHPQQASGFSDAQNFKRYAEQQRKSIGRNTSAEDISLKYADILHNSFVTQCKFRGSDQAASASIKSATEKYALDARSWLFFAGIKCPATAQCYHLAYQYISDARLTADERDYSNAHAAARLANLPAPSSNSANGYGNSWLFDFDKDEKFLNEVVSIQFDLSAFAMRRAKDAKIIIDEQQALLDAAQSKFDGLMACWNSPVPHTVDTCANAGISPLTAELAKISMKQATDLSASASVDAATIVKTRDSLISKLNSMAKTACDHLHYVRVEAGHEPGKECGT